MVGEMPTAIETPAWFPSTTGGGSGAGEVCTG
jgi:hypothetical protein